MPPLTTPVLMPESGGAYIGSASHLISAALQTAGLFFQSDLLSSSWRLLVAIGVLCFVYSVVKGITDFTVSRKAGALILSLVSPVAVYFLLFTRLPTQTVLHQIGQRVTPQSSEDQIFLLKQIAGVDYYDRTPSVSWIFVKFDNAVSNLVQTLTAFLVDTKNREDLVNIGRESLFSQLIGLRSSDSQLISLMSMGLIGECAELTRNSSERATLNSKIDSISKVNPSSSFLVQANTELARLEANVAKLSDARIPLTNSIGEFVSTLPMNPRPGSYESLSCDEIWRATREAFSLEAERMRGRIVDEKFDSSQRFDVPWDKVLKDVDDILTGENPGRANEVIATYMLRNTMATAIHRGLMEQISSHVPINTFKSTIITGRLAKSEAEGELLMIKLFDGFVPYIQGLLLFVLTATFPLFSLLLLLPNRISGFLCWFALWIWVKSWDVGFAFIHTIRSFLWMVMEKSAVPDIAKLDWANPSKVFQVIGSTDPTHGLTTYFTIIAVLTLFIPVVTAHLCLGASQLYGAFKNGLETTPRRYKAAYSHSNRRQDASELEREGYRVEEQKALDAMTRAAQDYQARSGAYLDSNDPQQNKLKNEKGFRRAESSGPGLARYLDKAYQDGRYKAHWSPEVIQLKAALSVFPGRPVTHSGSPGTSMKITQGIAAERAEMFDIRPLELSHDMATDPHTDNGRSALRSNTSTGQDHVSPSKDSTSFADGDG